MSARPTAESLVAQGEFLAQLLTQSLDAVVIIDESNSVTFFNAAAEQLFGMTAAAVTGQNVRILLPEELLERDDGFIQANRETGVNRVVGARRELRVERGDGTRRWATVSMSRVELAGCGNTG